MYLCILIVNMFLIGLEKTDCFHKKKKCKKKLQKYNLNDYFLLCLPGAVSASSDTVIDQNTQKVRKRISGCLWAVPYH